MKSKHLLSSNLNSLSHIRFLLSQEVEQYSGIFKNPNSLDMVLVRQDSIAEKRLSGCKANQLLHTNIEVPPEAFPTDLSCKLIKAKYRICVSDA